MQSPDAVRLACWAEFEAVRRAGQDAWGHGRTSGSVFSAPDPVAFGR